MSPAAARTGQQVFRRYWMPKKGQRVQRHSLLQRTSRYDCRPAAAIHYTLPPCHIPIPTFRVPLRDCHHQALDRAPSVAGAVECAEASPLWGREVPSWSRLAPHGGSTACRCYERCTRVGSADPFLTARCSIVYSFVFRNAIEFAEAFPPTGKELPPGVGFVPVADTPKPLFRWERGVLPLCSNPPVLFISACFEDEARSLVGEDVTGLGAAPTAPPVCAVHSAAQHTRSIPRSESPRSFRVSARVPPHSSTFPSGTST